MKKESLHLRVKIKLVKTLREGLPKTPHGVQYLDLKNGKRLFIKKAYGKYVVETLCEMINNNCTLDELVDIIIREGK